MRLYLIQIEGNIETTYDITEVVASFNWNGSGQQVSRSLEVDVLNAPLDTNLDGVPQISAGDFVKLAESESATAVFFGMFYNSDRASAIGTITYTAYDMLYHALKSSWSRSFKNMTPEAIALACCQEVGITPGNITATGIVLKKMLIDNESVYNTMLKAYNKASLINTKKYFFKMTGMVLDVIVKGYVESGILLTDDSNLTDCNIKEDASDLVNRVKIYDADGNQVGVVSDEESIKKYGVFQTTYSQQDGVNSETAAKENFKAPSQEYTCEAIGDMGCLSGYGVYIKDTSTGLVGHYWIIQDSHHFENGVHTMSLTLSFKNLMSEDELTYSEEDE